MIVLGNAGSGVELEIPRLRQVADGWDEVREVRRYNSQTPVALGDARIISGITGNFFVQSIQTLGCQIGQFIIEIVSMGLASEKDVVWTPTSYTDSASGTEGYAFPDQPSGTPVNFHAAIGRVGMTARYMQDGIPDMTEVGQNATPGVSGGVPTYPLTMTDNFKLYHAPAGWYLAKRDGQPLPYTSYYLVTDYFVYQPNPTIAGG